MAASLTRCYNFGPNELRDALAGACQECFARPLEWPPGSFTMRTGALRWPFTSYGERIEAYLSAPGTVSLRSEYVMPTQLFELGDNVANVERIARALETRLQGLAPRCPACGVHCARDAAFCTACGQPLFPPQPPVPARATRVRATGILVILAVFALPIAGLVWMYATILTYP